MARRDFFSEDGRRAVRTAVERAESQTSAELVVAVRRWSATYRAADYLAGGLVAFAVLLLLLFHPYEIPVESMPMLVLLGFVLGAFVCSGSWALERALTPSKVMDEAVANAARAVFVDREITRTSGRNGVLIFVSMLERRVDVVCDIGIDVAVLGSPFREGIAAVKRAVAETHDIASFSAAVEQLGGPLGRAMPRQVDDVNELPDDPVDA